MIAAHGVPLAALTTLGIGGPAKRLVDVENVGELQAVLRDAEAAGERVLVLGGGSNLVVGDGGFDGVVIRLAMKSVRISRAGDVGVVSASAGVVWDELVAQTIDAGLAGLECLSGIPGLVGATPMQNVGAYGQEIADTLYFVRAFDRRTGEVVKLERDACGFAYRTSMFKGSDRWIILDTRFVLPPRPDGMPVRYAELARALGVSEGGSAPLARVRETVLALRRGKGMVVDPADPESRSAGSFFTNPIVAAEVAARLPADAPRWPQPDGRVKLAAAWLIERAGFAKGHTEGAVGISRKHALALVNRGGATAAELLGLARTIQAGVAAAFGVALEPEPVIVE